VNKRDAMEKTIIYIFTTITHMKKIKNKNIKKKSF